MSLIPNSICSICSNSFENSQNLISTKCHHTFHQNCLMTHLEQSSSCPICKSTVNSTTLTQFRLSNLPPTSQGAIPKGKSSQPKTSTMKTRSVSRLQEIDSNRNLSLPSNNVMPEFSGDHNSTVIHTNTSQEDRRSNNSDLRDEINRIYKSIEVLTQKLEHINLNRIQPDFPQDLFSAHSRHASFHNIPNSDMNFININGNNTPHLNNTNQSNLNPNEPEYNRNNNSFSSIALANSSKIASVINSWNVRFDGSSSNFPVGKFLYVIAVLTTDSLGGDFQLLCEHFHILLSGRAKEWYWRYRSTARKITWETLSNALRTNFADHLSDNDIREMIRERKQIVGESFDEYYAAILKLCDRMKFPLSETDLVETLRRNLRPQIRKELFYIDIRTVSQLRHLVLKREVLYVDLEKYNSRPLQTKRVSEIEFEKEDENYLEDVSEIRNSKEIICWNCRNQGHRFTECLEDRTIFCYGCGSENVFKPNCQNCQNQGNLKTSGSRSKK